MKLTHHDLPEYCREEIVKFRTFLTSKKFANGQLLMKLMNCPSEKCRFGCSLRS